MKKLIVFGLVAVAACAVNAASFSWNAAVNGVDGNGNTLTSTADAATFVLAYLGNGSSASYENAVAVQTGTWSIGTTKGVSNAKVSGKYDGSGVGGLADGNVYAVMVKDDNGNLHQVAGTSTYTVTVYSGDTWSGADFQFATSAYVADKASYNTVPEPTSGILMLVGLGALALRRRRA